LDHSWNHGSLLLANFKAGILKTSGSTSGLPAANYATMPFLRGPCNPSDPNPASNQTAQFCRQCHADKSNEMNGSSAGTVF
jgi:hypothetical protein